MGLEWIIKELFYIKIMRNFYTNVIIYIFLYFYINFFTKFTYYYNFYAKLQIIIVKMLLQFEQIIQFLCNANCFILRLKLWIKEKEGLLDSFFFFCLS